MQIKLEYKILDGRFFKNYYYALADNNFVHEASLQLLGKYTWADICILEFASLSFRGAVSCWGGVCSASSWRPQRRQMWCLRWCMELNYLHILFHRVLYPWKPYSSEAIGVTTGMATLKKKKKKIYAAHHGNRAVLLRAIQHRRIENFKRTAG